MLTATLQAANTTVRRPLPGALRLAFLFFLILEEIDFLTTIQHRPWMMESNMFVASVLAAAGAFGFVVVKAIASVVVYAGISALSTRSRLISGVLLFWASSVMLGVVSGNLHLLIAG